MPEEDAHEPARRDVGRDDVRRQHRDPEPLDRGTTHDNASPAMSRRPAARARVARRRIQGQRSSPNHSVE